MTARHTPGPWIREGTAVWALTPNTRSNQPAEVNRFYISVQQCNQSSGGAGPEEVEAVAKVVRAAPELYDALEAIMAMQNPRQMRFLARAALSAVEAG